MIPFSRQVNIAKQYSKSSYERLCAMEVALCDIERNQIAGDIVECGVWRGGNIMLARMTLPNRHCWLYDTFEGMPKPGPYDMKRGGETAQAVMDRKTVAMSHAPLDVVRNCFEKEKLLDESKMTFVVGKVEDTLRKPENIPDRIALLRLDTDWYDSTKVELEVLWPRLASGGILIVDDYGHWLGARKAVNDYLCAADRERLKPIDYTAVMLTKS